MGSGLLDGVSHPPQSSQSSPIPSESVFLIKSPKFCLFARSYHVPFTIPLGLQPQLAAHDVPNPVRGNLPLVIFAMFFSETSRDLLDGNAWFVSRLFELADNLQNVSLHVHASIRHQIAVVVAHELTQGLPGIGILDDTEQRHKDLRQARLH